MMDDRALMQAHITALFVHDDRGRMTHVNVPDGQRAPRFFLGRTAHGVEWRVRDDVDDPQLLQDLWAAVERGRNAPNTVPGPESSAPYEELLSRSAPVQRIEAGPAFCFPDTLPAIERAVRVTEANASVLHAHLAPWIPDITQSPPLFAMLHEGAAVAVCGSVRLTAHAHEAGVETVPEFRGRGYGSEVVVAWARAVRDMGVTPLYSTSWSNAASRAVARKLGLRLFGSDLHLT